MAKQGQNVRVYRGDEFRNLIRQYSKDRMLTDKAYRHAVHSAIAKRRQAQKAQSQAVSA